jgi:hypothetical protein
MQKIIGAIAFFAFNSALANELCYGENGRIEQMFLEFNQHNKHQIYQNRVELASNELGIIRADSDFEVYIRSDAKYSNIHSDVNQSSFDSNVETLFNSLGVSPQSNSSGKNESNSYNLSLNVSKKLYDFGKNKIKLDSIKELVKQQESFLIHIYNDNKRRFFKLYSSLKIHNKKQEINALLLNKLHAVAMDNEVMHLEQSISDSDYFLGIENGFVIRADILNDSETFVHLKEGITVLISDKNDINNTIDECELWIKETPDYNNLNVEG